MMARRFALLCLLSGCSKQFGVLDTGVDGSSETPLEECPIIPEPTWPGCMVTRLVDAQADGRHAETYRYLYDGRANLISSDYRSPTEAGAYGLCSYRWTEDDEPIDEVCVGSSTYTYVWLYDDQQRPAGKVYDSGADGLPDKIWAYVLDGQGQLTQEIVDSDFDGQPDSFTFHTYDDEGREIKEEWDYDGDGAVDFSRTNEHDAWGRLSYSAVDRDGDGLIDESQEYFYDANGNLDTIEEDVDGDGDGDASVTYWYEGCRRVGYEAMDAEGAVSWVEYSYDEAGRRVLITYDWDIDGVVDSLESFTYTCP